MTTAAARILLLTLLSCGTMLSPVNIFAECIEGDCASGLGTYAWPSGEKYAGAWKNGKPDGKGSFIWPEGDRYVGEWKDGRSSRPGTYIYPVGAELHSSSLPQGVTSSTGCVQGDCVNGHGTYTWLSGAKYVGAFENGERNGAGAYSFPNGRRIEGMWNNGRYVGKLKPRFSNWGG